jgi:cardiolipin synthase A/B
MRRLLYPAAASLLLGLAACKGLSSIQAAAPPASTAAPAVPLTAGAGALRVLAEPGAGLSEIYGLITGARSSVDLTMYELRDQTAEHDLAADAARHVKRWASAGTTYHQKTLTVDGRTSVIMTLNMVTSDYPGTRDFAVIDTAKRDVAAIITTFDADFGGQRVTPPDGADLVWSPTNATASILAVINGARKTLAVENEEMHSSAVTGALARAAGRRVDVKIVMTADSEWDSAFATLARAGVHIRLYPDSSSALYIHAKAIVAVIASDYAGARAYPS